MEKALLYSTKPFLWAFNACIFLVYLVLYAVATFLFAFIFAASLVEYGGIFMFLLLNNPKLAIDYLSYPCGLNKHLLLLVQIMGKLHKALNDPLEE
jgi:hypothetical protein